MGLALRSTLYGTSAMNLRVAGVFRFAKGILK
jgi:hypothetical protein